MDFQKVKSMIINSRWKDPKSGNEYRSLSRQIDNILKNIKDEGLPLQWLPLDVMTEDELAQFISVALDRNGSRELFNNLKYKGIKRGLDDLIVSNIDEIEQKSLREEFPTLGNTRVRDVLPEIRCSLRLDYLQHNVNFKQCIAYIINCSDAIRKELERENSLAMLLGLKIHNPDYLEAYADFVDGCVSEILIYEILLNDKLKNKVQVLDFIWKQINIITDDALKEYANKQRQLLKKLRNEKNIFTDGINEFS